MMVRLAKFLLPELPRQLRPRKQADRWSFALALSPILSIGKCAIWIDQVATLAGNARDDMNSVVHVLNCSQQTSAFNGAIGIPPDSINRCVLLLGQNVDKTDSRIARSRDRAKRRRHAVAEATSALPLRVQLVTATLLVVYRQGFRSPRSSAGVD